LPSPGVGRCWYPSRSTPSASSWDPRPGDWAARYLEGILNWPLCALRLLDTLYKLFFSAPIGTSVQSSKSSTGLPLKDSLDGVEITRVKCHRPHPILREGTQAGVVAASRGSGRPGVYKYPVKQMYVIWKVAGSSDQRDRRFHIPRAPGLSSTIHVAQGTRRCRRS
jgi:hypothetical protein